MKKQENMKKKKWVNNWNRPEKREVMKLRDRFFKTAIINAVNDVKNIYKYYKAIDVESQRNKKNQIEI